MADEQPKVYPSTRYRKLKGDPKVQPPYETVIVNNEEEDRKLGAGWFDTPAAFAEDESDETPARTKDSKVNDAHAKAVESTEGGFKRK